MADYLARCTHILHAHVRLTAHSLLTVAYSGTVFFASVSSSPVEVRRGVELELWRPPSTSLQLLMFSSEATANDARRQKGQ